MDEDFKYSYTIFSITSSPCRGSGIAVSAALQTIATIPPVPFIAAPVINQNETLIEFDRTYNPLRDEILVDEFKYIDGYIYIFDQPGLGIEINEKI